MTERLASALATLAQRQDGLSSVLQDELAQMIEAVVSPDPVDPLDLMTVDELAELDRRLATPFEPVDSAEINAFFEKHGVQSNF